MKNLRYLFLSLVTGLSIYANAKNCFTISSTGNNLIQKAINKTYTKPVTVSPFRNNDKISGLSISGKVTKKNDDYLVRVILKDKEGHKHCVLESYNMINNSHSFSFSDYCEETAVLKNIETDSVIVILHNAELILDNISIACKTNPSSAQNYEKNSKDIELKKAQINSIVNRINEYNIANRRFWGAGVTPLALKRYEEKMKVLGLDDNESTEGYEYYRSGIFVSGSNKLSVNNRNSLYISQYDWCNRHGRNWITGIRDQGNSNFCFAFTAVAAIESMLMLYYNSSDSVIMSSDQAARCTYDNAYETYHEGGYASDVLEYAKNYGICDDNAFPFIDSDIIPCRRDLITPNEIVKITDYSYYSHDTEDYVKGKLIKNGPLTSGFLGHAMLLVGYGVVQVGDVIRVNYGYANTSDNYTVQPGDTCYIGKTYWKFKNSYGYNSNITVDGYSYIIFNDLYYMRQPYSVIHPYCVINTLYNIQNCEDKDGDGYYFWGMGPKPNNCPSWIPDTPDGDDSNINLGVMDDYGNLQSLQPNGVTICSSVVYNTNQTITNRIGIVKNGTLVITGTTTMSGNSKIRVCENGTLIVDGGTIQNANIELIPGCHVIVCNNGTIIMASGYTFDVPKGAVVDVYNGTIN